MRTRIPTSRSRTHGFTLLEVTIVITLTGIVAAMVAVFIPKPINAYVDQARRAELTDTADTALRRVAREIANALPNSVRVDPTGQLIEFLPVSAGGRYRAAAALNATGDFLDFTSAADGSFDVLGPVIDVVAGDQLVVYNLGVTGADAYTGESRRALTSIGTGLGNLTYTVGALQFPYPSPGSRFQIVNTPVTIACVAASPINGSGTTGASTLTRYTGYSIQANQPTNTGAAPLLALTGRNKSVIANKVSSCSFAFSNTASGRSGLVTLRLNLLSAGETLSLVQQVYMDNSP